MRNVFLLGIVEPDAGLRDKLKDVFRAAGYRAEIASNIDEARAMFSPAASRDGRDFDLVITEYDLEGGTGLDIIELVRSLNPRIQTLLMTSYDVNSWIEEAMSHNIDSIIAKTKPLQIDELLHATRALLTGDIFGLEQHLRKEAGPAIVEHVITRSADKEPVIQAIAGSAARYASDGENTRDVVALVLDEMINNALYAAPRTTSGDYCHAKGMVLTLPPGEQIRVRYGRDDTLFGFSVSDPHGTLRRRDVLEALVRQVKGEGLDDDSGGGGFYLIRSFIDRLVINISRGRKTEIIGLLHLPLDRDEAEQRNKSLLIFQTEGENDE